MDQVTVPLDDSRPGAENQGVSDNTMEQPRGEQVLPSADAAAEPLSDGNNGFGLSVDEKPPATITETDKEEAPLAQPDSVKGKTPPLGVDKPPATPEPAIAETGADFGVEDLVERVKQTDAIGVFTKLAIRSEALDLIDMVKRHRQNAAGFTLARLRSGFDGLLLKVLALLDGDPGLAQVIYQAREQLWQSLLEVKV